jgi:hypothetical protein
MKRTKMLTAKERRKIRRLFSRKAANVRLGDLFWCLGLLYSIVEYER